MSIELVGFENLPNAFIKDISITKENERQNHLEITLRVHDLPDRTIWSSTEEIFFQLMRAGVVVSTDLDEIDSLTNGTISPLSVKHMTKSLAISPQITEDSSYFELKFNHSISSQAANVSVFAFCFISKEDVSTSLGITISDDYLGPIKSENVFRNMSIVANTHVFVRQDGSYWSGPVHENNGNFMEGSYHTNTAHARLTRRTIVNTKIKDKRDVIETKHSERQPINNFISKLFVSYSSTTDINSIFMVNIKAMLMKYTKYGAFLGKASDDVVSAILNQLNFRMISIQRQRIKANYRSSDLRSAKRKAALIFHKKNILNTQDDANRKILNKMRLERNGSYDVLPNEIKNTSDYKKIADIEEMFFTYGSEIRTFQFTDYELTSKTPGDYQYKIQFQFADPVDRFLRNALSSMKLDISELTTYINMFKRRGALAIVGASDIVKNYLDYYSYIYQLDRTSRTKLTHKYISLLNPATANLASISKFLKEYKALYNDFTTFIDHDDQKRNNTPLSIKSKEGMSSRIVVEKTFDEIITPSNNAFSYSYLPENSNKKTAVFSKTNFFNQAQQQVEEQFIEQPNFATAQVPSGVSAGINDTQTTKTRFFGPNGFLSGLQQNKMTNGLDSIKALNRSRARDIIKRNRKPQASLTKTPRTDTTFLAVEPVPEPTQETEQGQFIDADEILGSGHEFVSYSESEADYNKPSIRTKPQEKISNALLGYNNRSFNATLEAVKKISPEEAKELPNHLKAVINGQSNATRSNFVSNGNDLLAHPTTKNYYEVKNFSVKEAIYIDGFEKDPSGNLLLNKPIYKTLMLNEFERLTKPALCFLKDYSNEKFNISGAEEVQAINSVFVIADSDITTPSQQIVSPTPPIYNTQDVEYQFMSSNIVKQTNAAVSAPSASGQTTTQANRFFGSY